MKTQQSESGNFRKIKEDAYDVVPNRGVLEPWLLRAERRAVGQSVLAVSQQAFRQVNGSSGAVDFYFFLVQDLATIDTSKAPTRAKGLRTSKQRHQQRGFSASSWACNQRHGSDREVDGDVLELENALLLRRSRASRGGGRKNEVRCRGGGGAVATGLDRCMCPNEAGVLEGDALALVDVDSFERRNPVRDLAGRNISTDRC